MTNDFIIKSIDGITPTEYFSSLENMINKTKQRVVQIVIDGGTIVDMKRSGEFNNNDIIRVITINKDGISNYNGVYGRGNVGEYTIKTLGDLNDE